MEATTKNLLRAVDANINRLKEGLRVIEDISRFIFDDKEIAKEIKHLRHQVWYDYKLLIPHRDVSKDILKGSFEFEKGRKNILDVVVANFKRAQEASRVLEELFKILDYKEAEKYKQLRYKLYLLESSFLKRAES